MAMRNIVRIAIGGRALGAGLLRDPPRTPFSRGTSRVRFKIVAPRRAQLGCDARIVQAGLEKPGAAV